MLTEIEVFRHLCLGEDWDMFWRGEKTYLENTKTGVVKIFEWRKYCCDCCGGNGFKPKKDWVREEFENFELE